MLPAPPTENDFEKAWCRLKAGVLPEHEADVLSMAAVEVEDSCGVLPPPVSWPVLGVPFPLGVEVVINRQLALADDPELRSGRDTALYRGEIYYSFAIAQ